MIEIYDPDIGSDGDKGYIRFRDAYGSEIVMQNSAIRITVKGSLIIDSPDIPSTDGGWLPYPATSESNMATVPQKIDPPEKAKGLFGYSRPLRRSRFQCRSGLS